MPRHPVTNRQLQLCDNPYGNSGLPQPSYLRVNRIYEIPPEALVEKRSYHRELELRQKPYDELIDFKKSQNIIC